MLTTHRQQNQRICPTVLKSSHMNRNGGFFFLFFSVFDYGKPLSTIPVLFLVSISEKNTGRCPHLQLRL